MFVHCYLIPGLAFAQTAGSINGGPLVSPVYAAAAPSPAAAAAAAAAAAGDGVVYHTSNLYQSAGPETVAEAGLPMIEPAPAEVGYRVHRRKATL